MNERREVVFEAPEAPEGSGLDAFLEAIRTFDKRKEALVKFSEDVKAMSEADRLASLQQMATHLDQFPFLFDWLIRLLKDKVLNQTDLSVFVENMMDSEYKNLHYVPIQLEICNQLPESQRVEILKKGLEDSIDKVREITSCSIVSADIPEASKITLIEKVFEDSSRSIKEWFIREMIFLPANIKEKFQAQVSPLLKEKMRKGDWYLLHTNEIPLALEEDRLALFKIYFDRYEHPGAESYDFLSCVPEADRAELITIGLQHSDNEFCLAAIQAISQASVSDREKLQRLALRRIKS